MRDIKKNLFPVLPSFLRSPSHLTPEFYFLKSFLKWWTPSPKVTLKTACHAFPYKCPHWLALAYLSSFSSCRACPLLSPFPPSSSRHTELLVQVSRLHQCSFLCLKCLSSFFFFHQTPTHTVKPKPHDSSSLWYHPRFFPSLMSHTILLGMVWYRFLNPSLAQGCTRAGGWISASPLPQGPEWGLFQSRWSGRVSERLIFLWFTFTY